MSSKSQGGDGIRNPTYTCNQVPFNVCQRKRKYEDDGEMASKRRSCEEHIILISSGGEDPGIRCSAGSPREMSHDNIRHPTTDTCNEVQINVGGRKRKREEEEEISGKRRKCDIITITSSSSEDIILISSDGEDADDEQSAEAKKRGTNSDLASQSRSAVSEDEIIYEMASTGNMGSRADFDQKYKQLGRIGKGGFGSVYKGYRISDHYPVAIKHVKKRDVICKDVTLNGKVYSIIVEVAFMLKSSGLPGSRKESGTVSLIDFYNLDTELILVMENPDASKDLFTYCIDNGGTIDEHNAKLILKQLVDIAIHMHTQGIFHRDIKLENVLIQDVDGVPKVWIIDFGCSSFCKEDAFDAFSGTLAYAPPEWLIQCTYWSRPTTVWQLGMLFYALLVGELCHPFQVFNKIRNSWLSGSTERLLYDCLTCDPKSRIPLEQLQQSLSCC